MAKKLIKRIADKFRTMNETEIKEENKGVNPDTEQNEDNTTPQAEGEATDNIADKPADTATEALVDWEARYNEEKDKYLRLYSEFDNYRRRSIRESADLRITAGAEMLKAVIPIVDDFERGLKNMETATDVLALREGVELIYSKLKNTLQGKGLEEMKAVGQPFDADIHEAITQVPVADESQKGTVIEELEKGYYLHGKVVRYAKVIVGS